MVTIEDKGKFVKISMNGLNDIIPHVKIQTINILKTSILKWGIKGSDSDSKVYLDYLDGKRIEFTHSMFDSSYNFETIEDVESKINEIMAV